MIFYGLMIIFLLSAISAGGHRRNQPPGEGWAGWAFSGVAHAS